MTSNMANLIFKVSVLIIVGLATFNFYCQISINRDQHTTNQNLLKTNKVLVQSVEELQKRVTKLETK